MRHASDRSGMQSMEIYFIIFKLAQEAFVYLTFWPFGTYFVHSNTEAICVHMKSSLHFPLLIPLALLFLQGDDKYIEKLLKIKMSYDLTMSERFASS